LAIVEGVPITSSAVKISYSHPEDVSCAGKTVILKKLRKHLRAKYAQRVGGEYYNKIPSAEDKANAIDAMEEAASNKAQQQQQQQSTDFILTPAADVTTPATATTTNTATAAMAVHEEESQAVPLLPRMTLTDEECLELKRSCGSLVTRKTRTYPGIFHWQEGGTLELRACKRLPSFPPSTPQVMLLGCSSSPET
jgi:hypothetical protein